LKDNSLCAAGAKVLGEGLKGNQSTTELDLSGNHMGKESRSSRAKSDMSGVIALADAIGDIRALSNFTFSGKLKPHEAQIVAAFLPKCT
jgi:hypothetical protein